MRSCGVTERVVSWDSSGSNTEVEVRTVSFASEDEYSSLTPTTAAASDVAGTVVVTMSVMKRGGQRQTACVGKIDDDVLWYTHACPLAKDRDAPLMRDCTGQAGAGGGPSGYRRVIMLTRTDVRLAVRGRSRRADIDRSQHACVMGSALLHAWKTSRSAWMFGTCNRTRQGAPSRS
jgi:hypothetical protein